MENQIVLYQAEDETTSLEVRVEDETVWLNRHQIAYLFDRDIKTIGKHINNVFNENELDKRSTVANFATVQNEGGRIVERQIEFYNLDVIISVGYRVKSKRGTQFRIWANKVLKDYLLKGYAVNHRIDRLEDDMHTVKNKLHEIDFHIQASLPPNEGIFFNGQIFDAWVFATDLVKTAKKSIVLIDNYVDEQVLLLLSKRKKNVSAKIYTKNISKQFSLDVKKHNSQYPEIEVKQFSNSHDRFLILDNKKVYHIGASLKDLGKKWFAFSKIDIEVQKILENLPE
ncbi:MAG: virulence RhuM family protein [Bacteroidota bacterium]